MAFTSSVYPEAKDDEANKKLADAAEKSKVKGRVFERSSSAIGTPGATERGAMSSSSRPAEQGRGRHAGRLPTPRRWIGRVTRIMRFSGGGRSPLSATSIPTSPRESARNNDVFVTPAAGGPIHAITTNKANETSQLLPRRKYLAYRPWPSRIRVLTAGPDALRPAAKTAVNLTRTSTSRGATLGGGRFGRLLTPTRKPQRAL